jgi:hypothetical protein
LLTIRDHLGHEKPESNRGSNPDAAAIEKINWGALNAVGTKYFAELLGRRDL